MQLKLKHINALFVLFVIVVDSLLVWLMLEVFGGSTADMALEALKTGLESIYSVFVATT